MRRRKRRTHCVQLTAAHALADNLPEARRTLAVLREVQPSLRLSTASKSMPAYRRLTDMERFLDGLRLAGLPE